MQAVITMQGEALPIVRAGINMKRRALELNLRQYQAKLAAFEKRHGMTADQFVSRFGAGELGDESEWFEWEFVFDAYRETARQLDLLRSVQL
ncbi:MAG: hypothetical protein AUK03_17780 [Anaerolineae bacterium CG2_30_64_16]|nr:MAG: hypothetical protein AUK03_17780 [Anaerolineae bacterium CG2_30_64_16]